MRIINTNSATPFSAGQTFHLFDDNYGGNYVTGVIPGNTGSSTNTFPTIIPATPGPGLAWDLRNLWVPNQAGNSGNIGVISVTTFPTLTNSFAMITIGSTNFILSQLSWDSSWYGARLENQINPLSVGLSTNWSNISPPSTNTPVSWATTSYTLTNVLGTNGSTTRFFIGCVYP